MPLPTRIYELSSWKGLNSYDAETDVDPHYLTALQNVEFDEGGVIAKRRGASKVNITFSGSINMIYDYQTQQGIGSTATDKIRTIIVDGAVLSVVKNFNDAGQTIEATFSATNALHYATTANNGACYISNENGAAPPKLLTFTSGAWQYISAELNAPAGSVNATGGTGGLSGTHSAKYTYEDIFGNESNPSLESTSVSLSTQSLDVGVTVSADPTVSLINLYVRGPAQSFFQFSRTAGNTTATISHTIGAAQLSSGDVVEEDHYPAPKGKYVTIYNDMLLISGDPTLPDVIWISKAGRHREFSTTKDFARVVSGDGQPVRGFGRSYNNSVIGKADSLYIGDGADETTYGTKPSNQDYGVLGQPSMVFYNNRLAFFSDDGIYIHDGLGIAEISQIIRNTLRTLNPANLATDPPKQFAATYKYYKQILWSVREATGAGENDTLLVWSYERNTWTRWKGNAARYLAPVQNRDDYEFLYGGDSAGRIFQYTPPNGGSPNRDTSTGTTSSISAYAETPWINFAKVSGATEWERVRTVPRYLKIYASGEPAGTNTTISMTVSYFVDFNPSVVNTFSVTFNAASWPTVKINHKTIYYGGSIGTYHWAKFRFENALLDEHFKLHQIVFGFKLKPPVD